jgi:hypothetical protein
MYAALHPSLFETEGATFTDHGLVRRFAGADRMLTDLRRSGKKIATVAYNAGFGGLSSFDRGSAALWHGAAGRRRAGAAGRARHLM